MEEWSLITTELFTIFLDFSLHFCTKADNKNKTNYVDNYIQKIYNKFKHFNISF